MKTSARIILTSTIALIAVPLGLRAAETATPRKVIVVTVTTGFRHSSIATAEKTLQKLADQSKAFEVVDFVRQPEIAQPKKPNKPKDLAANADEKAKAAYDKDLAKFNAWTAEDEAKLKSAKEAFDAALKVSLAKLSPENLTAQHIDGVIFANTTGDLPLPDKEGFIKWIEAGHAFMAMHSASDTFHGFPGYLDMLQGEFAHHGAQVGVDLSAGDTAHPANAGVGETWLIKQEEMYHIKHQDRAKVRALWYLKHDPNKVSELGHFPVSWCRMANTGRVFYTSLGHREDLWDDSEGLPGRVNSAETSRQFQAHVLGGIKWALGLADGSAEPNPNLQ